jgi:hypothetical protein
MTEPVPFTADDTRYAVSLSDPADRVANAECRTLAIMVLSGAASLEEFQADCRIDNPHRKA